MTEKHIHDCTGPEMTCSCGYSTDTRRKAADIIEDIVSCADECDGGGSDAEDYAKELYAVAFAAGQRSIQAGEAIPVSPTPDWHPIETAPKDGTEIEMWGPDGLDIGNWQDEQKDDIESGVVVDPGMPEGWYGCKGYWPGDKQPTHWRLPVGPAASPASAVSPTPEKGEE